MFCALVLSALHLATTSVAVCVLRVKCNRLFAASSSFAKLLICIAAVLLVNCNDVVNSVVASTAAGMHVVAALAATVAVAVVGLLPLTNHCCKQHVKIVKSKQQTPQ